MCSNTKKLLVYPIWHPGKDDFGLIAKEDVFLCSTYYKGMEMHGYRPYIMEMKKKLIFVDAVRTPPQVIVQWNQSKSNALTTRYMASGIKRFKGETRIMEYEIIPILRIKEATKAGFVEIHPGECFDAENPNSETRRGRKMTDKSNCLMAQNDTNFMKYEGPRIINLFGKKVRVLGIRRLTPTECSRLQTIPTWYKWECSDSQAYRMLGNGWTVEVIKHFFSFLPFEKEA